MKNLLIRTLAGLGFIVVMVGGIIWCKWSYAVLMLLILIGSMTEFMKLTTGTSYKFSRFLTVLAGVILFLVSFFYKAYYQTLNLPGSLIMLAVVPVAIVMMASLYVKDKTEYGKFAFMYTSILYIAIPLAITNLAAFDDNCHYIGLKHFLENPEAGLPLLSFFLLVWTMDTGSFIFGMAIGQKHGKKIAPKISPKKSWWGFWGGTFCTIVVAILLSYFGLLPMKWWVAAILGGLAAVTGIYGDLIESQWKRYYSVKDSGHTIPGHGGMLDRFDAALFILPTAVIFMEIIKLI